MRRIDKEKVKVFKRIGLFDLLCQVRENSATEILTEYIEVIMQPVYKDGSALIRKIIDDFYGMAMDHAYGKEKRPAGQQVFFNRDATDIAST